MLVYYAAREVREIFATADDRDDDGARGDAGLRTIFPVALTLRERNQIFDAINEGGIHPSGFTFEDYAARRPGWPTDVTIRHSATGSAFKISDSQIEWSVTDGPRAKLQSWASWAGLLDAVRDWARGVRCVSGNPDYWEELRRVREILGAAHTGAAGNARFTADEQAEMAHRIEAVKGQTRAMPELTSNRPRTSGRSWTS